MICPVRRAAAVMHLKCCQLDFLDYSKATFIYKQYKTVVIFY